MNTTEINQKIAEWLGIEKKLNPNWTTKMSNVFRQYNYFYNGIEIYPDFLHDRNQQKWIEEKLEKEIYEIHYHYVNGNWEIELMIGHNIQNLVSTPIYITKIDKSKSLAFLQAVEELIQEDKK